MKNGWTVALAATLMLVACGSGNERSETQDIEDAVAQTIEEQEHAGGPTFSEDLRRPNCLLGRPNTSRYPAPELAGVRLGMPRDEALAATFCEHREASVETQRYWIQLSTYGQELGAQSIYLREGPDDDADWIFLATPGMPGEERVAGVWRRETTEQRPLTTAVVQRLTQRFGAPGRQSEDRERSSVWLEWAWTPTGQPLSGDAMLPCITNVRVDPGGMERILDTCGLTVKARIETEPTNPQLSTGYAIAMVNPSAVIQISDRMEQQLSAANQARQAREASQAQEADAPRF